MKTYHKSPILSAILCTLLAATALSGEKPAAAELILFDGKTLDGWKTNQFAGAGEVHVEDGKIVIGMGIELTGITWTNKAVLPKTNYEITFEGQRLQGNDFFCGLTFPVQDAFCTLILGGWGGAVVGISNVNYADASENETTSYHFFEQDRWYKIRVRVTDEKLEVWLDADQRVDLPLEDAHISMRLGEIEQNVPLGISTWRTTGVVRNLKLRRLDAKGDAPAE